MATYKLEDNWTPLGQEGDATPDDWSVYENDEPNIASDIQESINLKQVFHLKWDRCLEYTRGNQNLLLNAVTQQYSVAKPLKRLEQVTINQILPLYRNVAARLATAYPSIAVLPANNTPDDILKSESSQAAISYFWSSENMKEKLKAVAQWLIGTGNVALHEYYDAEKNNVCLEVLSPYMLVYEPYVTSPDESDWVAIRRFVNKRELKRAYPNYATLIDDRTESQPRRYNGPQQQPTNRVEIFDVYWRDGRRATMIGEQYLFKGRSPSKILPVQLIRYTEIPGFLWGTGMVEPILEPQDLYNQIRSQILLNVKLMSNPKILIPAEAEISNNAFSSREGEKVFYKGGIEPKAFANAPIPAYAVAQIPELQAEMYDLSGIHSVSLGKRAVGVGSGKAINALSENDLSQLQLTQQNIEHAVQDAATVVLYLMKTYYNEGKMMRMFDTTGKFIFKELKATDIVDDPEVFIEAGSLFRDEAEDRDQKTLDLLKAGLIDAKEARKALSFRVNSMDTIDQMYEMQHAKDILDAIIKFGPDQIDLQIYPTDNLDIIEDMFRKFMRTPDYYLLPKDRQEAIALTYQHVIQMMHPNQAAQAGGNMTQGMTPQQQMAAAMGQTSQPDVESLSTPMQATLGQQQQQMAEETAAMQPQFGQTPGGK